MTSSGWRGTTMRAEPMPPPETAQAKWMVLIDGDTVRLAMFRDNSTGREIIVSGETNLPMNSDPSEAARETLRQLRVLASYLNDRVKLVQELRMSLPATEVLMVEGSHDVRR